MDNFEGEMKDMFDGVEFQPSERVWAGVEKVLREKKKKGIFFMWQTYGVAAAVALFITSGLLYKNGFFSNQPSPIQSTKTISESEEKATSDSLKLDVDSNDKLLTEKPNDNGGNSENISVQNVASKLLQASVSSKDVDNQIINRSERLASENQSMLSVSDIDVSATELPQELIEGLTIATIKPYRLSLAAAQADWLNRLGVDTSPLSEQLKTVEPKRAFTAQNSFSGRLGGNNFNISEPESGSALSARAEDANFQALSSIVNRQEETLGSVSIGLGFTFELSDRLSLNTALRYSELRTKTTSNAFSVRNGNSYPIYLPLGYDPDNVNFVGNYNLVNTLQGISFQPTLSYKFIELGKFDVSFLGGLGLDYFFSYRVKGDLNFLSVDRADLNDSDFIRKFNLSGISGVGMNYRLNDHFGIGADITYRYFIPTNGGENRRQSSVIGFGLGVNYFLKNKD